MSKPPLSPSPPDLAEGDGGREVEGLRDLVDVVVTDRDWANERALRFEARRARLVRCRLTGADLAEAALGDVSFDECRLDLAGLRHGRLERVAFRDCRMAECDFYGATLKDVMFERCELREATFTGVAVDRVELRGCELAGLRGVEALRRVRMPWNDVLANAALFAAVAGIEIVD